MPEETPDIYMRDWADEFEEANEGVTVDLSVTENGYSFRLKRDGKTFAKGGNSSTAPRYIHRSQFDFALTNALNR